jgi:hypothetical protein
VQLTCSNGRKGRTRSEKKILPLADATGLRHGKTKAWRNIRLAQYQVEVLPSGVGMAPLLQQQDAVKGQPRWTTPDDNMP